MSVALFERLWPGARRRPSPRKLGAAGERLAARRLRAQGFRIVARNVRRPFGEIDVVALTPDRSTLVCVEVKTRAVDGGRPAPPPEAALHRHKRETLVRLAHDITRRFGWTGRPFRVDVMAIDWPAQGRPDVRHYENAITSGR